MSKKSGNGKRGNGKEPKHVHVKTGPDKCLSYQVETTVDIFQNVLTRVSRKLSDQPRRTKPRSKPSHA